MADDSVFFSRSRYELATVNCVPFGIGVVDFRFDRGDRILDIKISDVSRQKMRWADVLV